MQAGPRIGTLLLLSVAGFSGLAAWGGQHLLKRQHQRLTPEVSQASLWQHYRWAIDPQTRREAALLMVARDGAPDLLHGHHQQGSLATGLWIDGPAVVLPEACLRDLRSEALMLPLQQVLPAPCSQSTETSNRQQQQRSDSRP